jgi:hypothetical protein
MRNTTTATSIDNNDRNKPLSSCLDEELNEASIIYMPMYKLFQQQRIKI